MNRQDIFEKAVKGLASQDFEQSRAGPTACLYRGPEGRRCAIGWCIPDGHYFKNMEGKSVSSDAVLPVFGLVAAKDREDVIFLERLQEIHDNALSQAVMVKRLIAFGERNGLNPVKELGQYA